jgi:hypothetical protein
MQRKKKSKGEEDKGSQEESRARSDLIHHPILPSTLSREGNQPKSTLFQKSHKKSLTIF